MRARAVVQIRAEADGPGAPAARRLTLCLADDGAWPARDLGAALADVGHEVHRLVRTADQPGVSCERGIWLHQLRPEKGAGPPGLPIGTRARLAWAAAVHAA